MIKKVKKLVIVGISLLMTIPMGIGSNSYADSTPRYADNYSDSAYVEDYATGRVIYEKNSDKKRAMASVSKLMTLLLTFDAIKTKKASYDDILTVDSGDVNRVGTNILLNDGDKISLRELMNGMMIVSANDAALTISRHIGGSYQGFVDMMNKKAKEIGMKNTIFYNPNGLPMYGKLAGKNVSYENTTTAKDVVILERYVYSHYEKELTEITDREVYSYSEKGINKPNTNPLLPLIKNVDGVKTGYTGKAGYNLAYSMKVDKGDGNEIENRILAVSLGNPSEAARKTGTYELLTFVNRYYKTKKLFDGEQTVASVKVKDKSFINLDLYVDEDVYVVEKVGEKLHYSYEFPHITSSTDLKGYVGKMIIKNQNGFLVRNVKLKIKSGFWRFVLGIISHFQTVQLETNEK